MHLITRQDRADMAAKNWGRQYENGQYGEDKLVIYIKLIELGENPDPDEVDRVIGNTSWTSTNCDECGSHNVDLVQLGEYEDFESATACICMECLDKAVTL